MSQNTVFKYLFKHRVVETLSKTDLRRKHGKHKRLNADLCQTIYDYTNLIPKVENDYIKATYSRQFIGDSRHLTHIRQDYVLKCLEKNLVNIRFFVIFYQGFKCHFLPP